MISFASQQEIKDIKKIWKVCFNDDEDYIEFYLHHHFIEKETLLYHKDGHAIAMLHLLDAVLHIDNKEYPICYVYAVATLPDYRGRGIAKKLISFANDYLSKKGIASVLVPAEENLFAYYEKIGYQTAFYLSEFSGRILPIVKESQIKAAEYVSKQYKTSVISEREPAFAFQNISIKEYKEIRDERFGHNPYIEWKEKEITYSITEHQQLGGEFMCLSMDGQKEVLMYTMLNQTLFIKETTLNLNQLQKFLPMLIQNHSCENFLIRSSRTHLPEGELRPFGMLYCSSDHPLFGEKLPWLDGYLNLVLD